MKKTKLFLLMALISATIFSAVVFTACTKKTTCSTVACRNGGVCNGDHCVCPTGYAGSFCETGVSSYVTYTNNTFTPVTLAITGGATQVLAVGGAMTVLGKYGTPVTGTATTSGTAKSLGVDLPGGIIGLTISWGVNGNPPSKSNDTAKVPLEVGATYYFLRMTNKGSQPVTQYTVNTFSTDSNTVQHVTIPNNSTTYDLGYYLAYPNSNIKILEGNGTVVTNNVTLPDASNQSATITVN